MPPKKKSEATGAISMPKLTYAAKREALIAAKGRKPKPLELPITVIAIIISYRTDQLMGRDSLVGINSQWLEATQSRSNGGAIGVTVTLPPFSQPNAAVLVLKKFQHTLIGLHNMPLPSIKAINIMMKMPALLRIQSLGWLLLMESSCCYVSSVV
jgi:hypothetical protein